MTHCNTNMSEQQQKGDSRIQSSHFPRLYNEEETNIKTIPKSPSGGMDSGAKTMFFWGFLWLAWGIKDSAHNTSSKLFAKLKHTDKKTCFYVCCKNMKEHLNGMPFVFKSTGPFCTLSSRSFMHITIDWAVTFHLLGNDHNCFQYKIK